MPNGVTPELLNFIITLCQFMLIAFGILIAGAAMVYTTLFWKGNFSGASIAQILQQTDIPKLATIILIVLAASLLGLLGRSGDRASQRNRRICAWQSRRA